MERLKSILHFRDHIGGILPPFFYQCLHVVRNRGVELQVLFRSRVDESQRLCMQGLARQQPEAVPDELAVFGIYGSLADFSSVIPLVIEKRMSYPSEMHPDLVGPACFQPALHYRYISETLQDLVVSHCMFPVIAVREHLETHPV